MSAMPSGRLAGKTAIVTGGARGIGAAIARRFAAEGAQVVVADILPSPPDLPDGGLFVPCDVSNPEHVRALIDKTLEAFGRLDIAINNAGRTGGTGPFLDVRLEDWQRYLDTNLTGVFLVGQAAARAMVERHIAGRIINIGSINSFAAEPGAAAYVASKGGVRLLTKAMAVELAGYGILVNMIAPGSILTERNAALFQSEPLRSGFTRSIPLGHPGAGADIAGAAVFLASDENQFITGASLIVDGGLTALLRYE